MAKIYLLTEEDFEKLKDKLNADPTIGHSMSETERRFYEEAHRHYNYIIHRWLDEVKK